jgi:hypothetical protein
MTMPETKLGPEGYDPNWDDIKFVGGSYMHFNRQGEPCSLRDWITGIENSDYRYVKRTRVKNVTVITAWTGIDIDCNLCEVPHIFGTIEQHGDGHFHDEELDTTEADALATHARRVQELEKE